MPAHTGIVLKSEGTTYTVSSAKWAQVRDSEDAIITLELHSIDQNGTPYIRVVDEQGIVVAEVTEENGLVEKPVNTRPR